MATAEITKQITPEELLALPDSKQFELVGGDLDLEVEEKVEEYLAAGVELVWVVRPPLRSIRVHRADGTVATLHSGDSLEGESVLPGFSCPVADLFK